MSGDVPDCTECGACCFPEYDSPDYVHLTAAEAQELVDAGHGDMVEGADGNMPSMKTDYDRHANCKCIALAGTLGKVRCTIYEIRPSVCRDFKPGSAVCNEARRWVSMIGSDR